MVMEGRHKQTKLRNIFGYVMKKMKVVDVREVLIINLFERKSMDELFQQECVCVCVLTSSRGGCLYAVSTARLSTFPQRL
jgi:hypothetical protein